MTAFFEFIASPAGRLVRILAGIVLIVLGFAVVQGVAGWILAIVGLVPLAAGAFDRCVFAPLFGLPFVGPQLRRTLREEPKA